MIRPRRCRVICNRGRIQFSSRFRREVSVAEGVVVAFNRFRLNFDRLVPDHLDAQTNLS